MAPDALRMLARQLRVDPNPDAIEDAACALEAVVIERARLAVGRTGAHGKMAKSGTSQRAGGPDREACCSARRFDDGQRD